MKQLTAIITLTFLFLHSKGQKILSQQYGHQAMNSNGFWYFVQYEHQSQKKIFFVQYEHLANLKIFFVPYSHQAGWKDKSKMPWMY